MTEPDLTPVRLAPDRFKLARLAPDRSVPGPTRFAPNCCHPVGSVFTVPVTATVVTPVNVVFDKSTFERVAPFNVPPVSVTLVKTVPVRLAFSRLQLVKVTFANVTFVKLALERFTPVKLTLASFAPVKFTPLKLL